MSVANRKDISFTAGILIRSQIRGTLDAMKMYGHISAYREAKSLLASNFYIKDADTVAVRNVRNWLENN